MLIKIIFINIFLVFGTLMFSQNSNNKNKDDLIKKDSIKIFNPILKDYSYLENNKNNIIYDSLFSVKKMQIYNNFLNKDNFGYLMFSNIGSAFNPLIFEDKNKTIEMVPFGKSLNLTLPENVKYYNVKTPVTQFNYNNGFLEGHALRTLFTHNINPNLNYAVEYYGLKSQGKYLLEESENVTFLTSINYKSKSNLYNLKAHFISTNINNQENGGIKNIEDFESNNSDFRQRERLQVNLESARSKYHIRRFFAEQNINILKAYKKDSLTYNPLQIKSINYYESSEYSFFEDNPNQIYFNSLLFPGINSVFNNGKNLKKFVSKTSINLNIKDYFKLNSGFLYENINYFLDENYINKANNQIIDNKIKDNRFGLIANMQVQPNKNLSFYSDLHFSVGNYFKTTYILENNLKYKFLNDLELNIDFNSKSVAPNINYILNQSYYLRYNHNFSDYKNILTNNIRSEIKSDLLKTSLSFDGYSINNYTFFNSFAKPVQISNINIARLSIENELNYKKFGLITNISFQANTNENILPLPKYLARITAFYKDDIFDSKARILTGIRFSYFDKFKSRTFNPIYNDFMISDSNKYIGDYPIFDAFLNLQVKRMRIFLEGQHFNSSFSKNFLVDPLRPYSDFRLNIGINWVLFN